jgi:hypothetical protein
MLLCDGEAALGQVKAFASCFDRFIQTRLNVSFKKGPFLGLPGIVVNTGTSSFHSLYK